MCAANFMVAFSVIALQQCSPAMWFRRIGVMSGWTSFTEKLHKIWHLKPYSARKIFESETSMVMTISQIMPKAECVEHYFEKHSPDVNIYSKIAYFALKLMFTVGVSLWYSPKLHMEYLASAAQWLCRCFPLHPRWEGYHLANSSLPQWHCQPEHKFSECETHISQGKTTVT